jgi:DNA damage-inducible protein 1
MLKAHQACIDLEKNVLRIQGREVRFLSDHELPDKARDPGELSSPDQATPSSGPSNAPAGSTPGPSSFPGSGHALGATPASVPRNTATPTQAQPAASRHPENAIRVLMDLGVSRQVAISTLDAAGGNLDVAASLLF